MVTAKAMKLLLSTTLPLLPLVALRFVVVPYLGASGDISVAFVEAWTLPAVHRYGIVGANRISQASRPRIASPSILSLSTEANSAREGNEKEKRRQQTQDMIDRATKLRQEAADLEAKLDEEGGSRRRKTADAAARIQQPAVVCDMKDSEWTFSYRFSDRPDDDDEEAESGKDTSPKPRRTFYSGKVGLKFRADGYTDLMFHEPRRTGGDNDDNCVEIVKAWGWDVEPSDDDGKDYLLFSVDVRLPPSKDDDDLTTEPTRFYFQARQENSGSDDSPVLVLKEGTVTMKQDITKSKSGPPGFWGMRGILASFRYVGDFVAVAR